MRAPELAQIAKLRITSLCSQRAAALASDQLALEELDLLGVKDPVESRMVVNGHSLRHAYTRA